MSAKKPIEIVPAEDWKDTQRAFGTVEFKTDERAMEPVRSSAGAAGWDLYTVEDVVLRPYRSVIVTSGIKVALPQGTVLLVVPRSGYSIKNQIMMPNSVGVIDEDYRGTIGISMMWTPPLEECFEAKDERVTEDTYRKGPLGLRQGLAFHIPKFTRIAQALLLPYLEQDWRKVDVLSETERGSGGFGHTGTGPGDTRPGSNGDKISR